YNSAGYLAAAVESVLSQTHNDFEVLVVDDGSTDDTPAVMRGFGPPVRHLRQPNAGVAAARNRGIAESRGRYVALLDARDLWHPHKLERQLAGLAAGGGRYRACYTAYLAVTSDLKPLGARGVRVSPPALADLLTRGNVVGTPSTVLGERSL